MSSSETSSELHVMPNIGDVLLGRYRLLHYLGSGGMGTVFCAADIELKDQPVAIKLLNPHLAAKGTSLARLKNEVLVSQRFNHPNLVRIYSLESTSDGVYFIVMEYIKGVTLSGLLDAQPGRCLPWPEAVRIISEVASGLAHVHSFRVMHRDLKPENILLNEEGVVKIADFGLARIWDSDLSITQAGDAVGTPYYMAPEQFKNAEVSFTADIYSLGIIAFELLTGRKPFTGNSYLALAMQHMGDKTPQMEGVKVPGRLREFVEICTQKQSSNRFVDMEAAKQSIIGLLDGSVSGEWSTLYCRYLVSKTVGKVWRLFLLVGRRIAKTTGVIMALLAIYVGLARINSSTRAEFAIPLVWMDAQLPFPLFKPLRALFGYEKLDPYGSVPMVNYLCNEKKTEEQIWFPYVLLRVGILDNKTDALGNTPMHCVASTSPRDLKMAIELGGDCNAHNNDKQTPFMLAMRNNFADAIGEMLPYVQQDVVDMGGNSPLQLAIGAENVELVKLLLGQRTASSAINLPNNLGDTPLLTAVKLVRTGQLNFINILLDAGADIHSRDFGGYTAALVAAVNLSSEVLESLLKRGGPGIVREVAPPGHTMLMLAASSHIVDPRRSQATISLLLKAGLSPSERSPSGSNSLEIARMHGHLAAIELLEQAIKNEATEKRNLTQK